VAATKCHPGGRLSSKFIMHRFGQSINRVCQLVEKHSRVLLVDPELRDKCVY
jgi:hypothetical protein